MLVPDQETQNNTLMGATLQLLQNRSAKIMLKQIAAEAELPYEWLCKFHQGKLEEPKHPKVIKKIEKLNKYLVSKLNPTLT